MIPINYVAVLLAAVAQVIIGSLWHGPLFGKYWSEITGIHPTEAEKKQMWKPAAIGFFSSLLIAYCLAHTVEFGTTYTQTFGVAGGLMAGFWTWLGVVAPVTLNLVLWERFSMKRWYFANAYHLTCFLVMAVILATWK
jgi:hypothetical protein